MAAGGIPTLVSMLPSRLATAQQAVVRALYMAAKASAAAHAAVCAAGGVQALVQLIRSSSTVRYEALEDAGATLMALCLEGGPDPTSPFLEAGWAPAVVSLLGHGSEAAQGAAMRAIASFAAFEHLVGQQALLAAGAVQPVVGCLLGAGGSVALAWAAIALAQLVRREGGALRRQQRQLRRAPCRACCSFWTAATAAKGTASRQQGHWPTLASCLQSSSSRGHTRQ